MTTLFLFHGENPDTFSKKFTDFNQVEQFRMWAWNRNLENFCKVLIDKTEAGYVDTPVYCDDISGIIRIWKKVQGVHDGEVGKLQGQDI